MAETANSGVHESLHNTLASFLDQIKETFTSDAGTRLLLVVRNTGIENADAVVGDADADECIDLIEQWRDGTDGEGIALRTTAPKGGAS